MMFKITLSVHGEIVGFAEFTKTKSTMIVSCGIL